MKDLSALRRILLAVVFIAAMAASVFCVLSASEEVQVRTVVGRESAAFIPEHYDVYAGEKININLASKEQLLQIPGISSAVADRIMEYRSIYGSFYDVGELREIEGIGDAVFQKALPYICT